MPAKTKAKATAATARAATKGDTAAIVRDVLARLQRQGSRRNRDGMARYGIVAEKVFGVSVGTRPLVVRKLAARKR